MACTELYTAALQGQLEEVQKLARIAQERDVINKIPPTAAGTALLAAVSDTAPKDRIVAVLLAHGADPCIGHAEQPNLKPLHIAAENGHSQSVAHLVLEDSSALLVRDLDGRTPEDCAREAHHYDIAAALHLWLRQERRAALRLLHAELLITKSFTAASLVSGAAADTLCKQLYIAARRGKIHAVFQLLPMACASKVVNKIPQGESLTALYIAAAYGHDMIVSLLLANGADVSIGDKDYPSYKPLHVAAYKGHALCVGLLLQADDSMLGVKDLGGRTPVDWAREHGQSGIVAAAQQWSSGDKRGALKTLGAGDLQGYASSAAIPRHCTSVCGDLYKAACDGKVAAVTKLLSEAQADGAVNMIPSYEFVTALWVAAYSGHVKVVAALLGAGADASIGHKTHRNYKPLHAAARNGHKACVAHLLLALGSGRSTDFLRVKHNGRTAADMARARGFGGVAAALQSWLVGDKEGALAALGAR